MVCCLSLSVVCRRGGIVRVVLSCVVAVFGRLVGYDNDGEFRRQQERPSVASRLVATKNGVWKFYSSTFTLEEYLQRDGGGRDDS